MRRKKVQAYSSEEPERLSGYQDYYRALFALLPARDPGSDRAKKHDFSHIITGFGFGILDETRLHSFDLALHGYGGNIFHDTKSFFSTIRYQAVTARKGFNDVPLGKLHTRDFCKAHKDAECISDEEIAAFFHLGKIVAGRLEALTGKPYRQLTGEEIGYIDFSAVDFTFAAQIRKMQFLSDRNAIVEEAVAQTLEDESIRLRGQHMPLPLSPWCGLHKRFFGA